jgi:hypothetical protein
MPVPLLTARSEPSRASLARPAFRAAAATRECDADEDGLCGCCWGESGVWIPRAGVEALEVSLEFIVRRWSGEAVGEERRELRSGMVAVGLVRVVIVFGAFQGR